MDTIPKVGRADTVVELVPYDDGWPARFEAAREELVGVLPGALIEHVGSTSVPRLSSKDTIDLVAGVVDVDAAMRPATLAALRTLGYDFVPASFADDPHHAFFQRVVADHRTEHLHVMTLGCEPMTDHLLFRDFLRADPDARARYEQAKQHLFRVHRDERDEYVLRKSPIVEALLAEARQWAGSSISSAQEQGSNTDRGCGPL